MMETVLNIGLNDASVKGLAEESRRRAVRLGFLPAAAADVRQDRAATCPARCSPTRWTRPRPRKGVTSDVDLDVDDLQGAGRRRSRIGIREHSGREFPQHPREQLDMAIRAVFDSWNTDRARLYRRRERIPQNLGTAVNICTMVFGNLGETSGTGVAFTRDPATGQDRRVRRLPGQRAGRGRRRRHPQHAVPGRPAPTGPGVAPAADQGDAPAGNPLPGPVRHRVHHRARQAVDAADPGRQAHRRPPRSGSPRNWSTSS